MSNLCFESDPMKIYNSLLETPNEADFQTGIIGLCNIVGSLIARIEELEERSKHTANNKFDLNGHIEFNNDIEKELENRKYNLSGVSKMVGWKDKNIAYPTFQDLCNLESIYKDDPLYIAYRLVRYVRFLKVPGNKKEQEILKKIIKLQDKYIEQD